MNDTRIITGEGVTLELPVTTVLSRILSGFIDYGLYTLVFIAGVLTSSRLAESLNAAQISVLTITLAALCYWLLPGFITGGFSGRSLGKLLTGTRVVTLEGGSISMGQSFIRATVGLAEILLTAGSVATITALFSKNGQRLGDMLAGTYVVRWPKTRQWYPIASISPSLAAWAQVVQTRALPVGLSLGIGDFIRRRGKLLPEVRQAQGQHLAALTMDYVSPPPPPGTPPEEFLEAVCVIRFKVEAERHARTEARRDRLTERLNHLSGSQYL